MGDDHLYLPSHEAPTTPFQRIEAPVAVPERVISPQRSRIRPLILLGAVAATVAAVVGVFAFFSAEQPDSRPAPTPARAESSPTLSVGGGALPEVPESLPYTAFEGKASKVTGIIADKNTLVRYPQLGSPWVPKNYAPYSIAQRVGKVAKPYTLIGSAMVPLNDLDKPKSEADYREYAGRTVGWAVRTQFPAGTTVTWTASQELVKGKGWMLGFTAAYEGGTSQALLAVVEVGKKKPAMVLAAIPDTRKELWPDLNTLVKGVRKS